MPPFLLKRRSNPLRIYEIASGTMFLAALLAGGCGDSSPAGPETVEVTGQVIFNGSPVEGAMVLFQPAQPGAGHTCQVETNAEGRFQMMTGVPGGKPKSGAVPGDYLVGVTKLEIPAGSEMVPPTSLLPQKFSTPQTSNLAVTVVAGEGNDFEFNLGNE